MVWHLKQNFAWGQLSYIAYLLGVDLGSDKVWVIWM